MPPYASAAGLFALSVFVGAYGTLIGSGGGFILVPVLLLLFPQETPAQLTAVSLAVVFASAASGSVSYYRLRRVDYQSGAILALATIPGAVAGVLSVGFVSRRNFALLLSVLLIVGSGLLLLRPERPIPLFKNARFGVSREIVDSDGQRYRYRFNLALAALFSLLIGFLSSLLGIGGGPILVPLLSTFFSFPTQVATATALFALGVMSAVGTLTHAVQGDYGGVVGRTLVLSAGVVVGAPLGAAISRRLQGSAILRLLALAVGIAGVRLFLENL